MTSPYPTDGPTKCAGFGLFGMLVLLLAFSLTAASLTVLLLPAFTSTSIKVSSDRVRSIRLGIDEYRKNHAGSFPPTLTALVVTDGVPCLESNNPAVASTYLTLQGWCGPYIDRIFLEDPLQYQTDGWGKVFSYANSTALITSCGPNQSCGDADDLLYAP